MWNSWRMWRRSRGKKGRKNDTMPTCITTWQKQMVKTMDCLGQEGQEVGDHSLAVAAMCCCYWPHFEHPAQRVQAPSAKPPPGMKPPKHPAHHLQSMTPPKQPAPPFSWCPTGPRSPRPASEKTPCPSARAAPPRGGFCCMDSWAIQCQDGMNEKAALGKPCQIVQPQCTPGLLAALPRATTLSGGGQHGHPTKAACMRSSTAVPQRWVAIELEAHLRSPARSSRSCRFV